MVSIRRVTSAPGGRSTCGFRASNLVEVSYWMFLLHANFGNLSEAHCNACHRKRKQRVITSRQAKFLLGVEGCGPCISMRTSTHIAAATAQYVLTLLSFAIFSISLFLRHSVSVLFSSVVLCSGVCCVMIEARMASESLASMSRQYH